jgi:hypothetical protein
MFFETIHWSELILNTTHFHASSNEDFESLLIWYPEGSTLYLQMENRPQVDIRVDHEILDLKVGSFYWHLSD